MANGDGNDVGALALEEALRNLYFYGQLVTARDLNDSQSYLLGKIKNICHALHGPGIVHGLDVTSVATEGQANVTVALKAGVAIDGFGRDVIVPEDVENVAVEIDRGTARGSAYLVVYLERDECSTEKVPAYANRSPCEASCCYSRVKEGYRVVGSYLSDGEWKAFKDLAEKYHGKTFPPDLVDVPKAADVFKYGERYINEGKVPGNVAKYGRRLTANGGVPIWAGRRNDKKASSFLEKGAALAALARRNVFAADTLFQMIAEHVTRGDDPHRTLQSDVVQGLLAHAADMNNPHQTPAARTKVICGKYELREFPPLTAEKKGMSTISHNLRVGKLTRDGKPVTGIVTSVTVGLEYSVKFNANLLKSDISSNFHDKHAAVIENLKKLTRARYTSELLFGYHLVFQRWQVPYTGPSLVKTILARELPDVLKQVEPKFTLVPKVEYEKADGKTHPTLTLNVTEDLSSTALGLSGRIYDNYRDGPSHVLRNPLMDCGITVYWSAAVADELDMDYKGLRLLPRRFRYEVPAFADEGAVLTSGLDYGLAALAAAGSVDFNRLGETIRETIGDTDLGKEVLAVLDKAKAVGEKAGDYVAKDPRAAAPEIEREVAELSDAPVDVVEAAVRGNEAILEALTGESEAPRVAALKTMGVAEDAGPAEIAEVEAAGRVRLARFEEILKEKRRG